MFKICSLTIQDLLKQRHTHESSESFESGLESLCQFTVFSKLLTTINNCENSEDLKIQLASILLNEKYGQLRRNFSQIPDNTWPYNLKIRDFYQIYIHPFEMSEPALKRSKH